MEANLKEKSILGMAGATISTIIAHLCCIAPLLLLTLGASGPWVSTFSILEPYKPVFLTFTFLFITYAFYNRYFKKPENNCTKANRKNNLTFWASNTFIILSLAFPYISPYFFHKDIVMENMSIMDMGTKKIVLNVQKMTCPACIPMVNNSLSTLKGVKTVKVTFNPSLAKITYDSEKTSPEKLIQDLKESGYPSTINK